MQQLTHNSRCLPQTEGKQIIKNNYENKLLTVGADVNVLVIGDHHHFSCESPKIFWKKRRLLSAGADAKWR